MYCQNQDILRRERDRERERERERESVCVCVARADIKKRFQSFACVFHSA